MKRLIIFARALVMVVALGCVAFAGGEVANRHLIPIGDKVFSVRVCYDSANWFSPFDLAS